MRRGLWFLAGTAAGVYATGKARRAAESLTLDGMHDRLTGWFAGARVLREEVEAGRREKETELRARLGLGPDGERRELAGGNVRQLTSAGRPASSTGPTSTTPTSTTPTSSTTPRKGDD